MRRRKRNLIVTSDYDEEDGEGTATTAFASVSASASVASGSRPSPVNPSPLPVPFPSLSLPPSAPVVISDDDVEDEDVEEISDTDEDSPFVDAAEDISPPAPAPPPPPSAAGNPTLTRTPTPTPPPLVGLSRAPNPTQTPTPTPLPAAHPRSTPPPSALNGRLRPVDELLRGIGLRLRSEWLESCAAGLPGFDGLGSVEAQAKRCFEQFLFADMNTCGAGVLPEGVGSMHDTVLDGPFVLQVDEVVNISAPLRERYRGTHAGPKRCLKLSMTDGMQRIFGMEYRPMKDLEALAPAGLKAVIMNVHIRRGLLMLVPDVFEILGGVVDELEAARDRLVSEVNKPPRGKRKQGGLPLSSRATLAAWSCSTNITNGGEQGISLPATVNSSHPTGLGIASQIGRITRTLASEIVSYPVMTNIVQEQNLRAQGINMQELYTSRHNSGTSPSIPYGHDGTQSIKEEHVDPSIMANHSHERMQCVQEVTMQEQANSFTRVERRSSTSILCEYESNQVSHAIGGTGANDVGAARSSRQHIQEINVQDLSTSRNNTGTCASVPSGHDLTHTIREEYVDSSIMAKDCHEPVPCVQEVTMQEQATAFLRTERRSSTSTPYWGTRQDTQVYIQGKIKGLITSVKSFQYKRRTEYELYVYIDDGSYISVALVDHNIVKNMIGLSPEDVTKALSGESMLASTSDMKETLRKLQRFLVKFEGMMLIEFNKNSSLPIVRELNEGCSSSDAWLLLGRIKTFSSRRRMQRLDDMDTTP